MAVAASTASADRPTGGDDDSNEGGAQEGDSCPPVGGGSPPSKGDLTNVYVATADAPGESGDHFLYLAWERFQHGGHGRREGQSLVGLLDDPSLPPRGLEGGGSQRLLAELGQGVLLRQASLEEAAARVGLKGGLASSHPGGTWELQATGPIGPLSSKRNWRRTTCSATSSSNRSLVKA